MWHIAEGQVMHYRLHFCPSSNLQKKKKLRNWSCHLLLQPALFIHYNHHFSMSALIHCSPWSLASSTFPGRGRSPLHFKLVIIIPLLKKKTLDTGLFKNYQTNIQFGISFKYFWRGCSPPPFRGVGRCHWCRHTCKSHTVDCRPMSPVMCFSSPFTLYPYIQ